MWNPRVTKITPLKAFSPCCRVLYVIGRIDQCPDERRRANRLSNETNGISVSVSLTEALSMVFTTESEQEGERKQHILLGSIDGVKGRALASHRCGPGSPLVVDAQCGLIVSLVCPYLYIARAVRGKTKSAVYMEF